MSTLVMHMLIPTKPARNNRLTFEGRASRLSTTVSSSAGTGGVRSCSTITQIPTARRSGNYSPSLWDFDYIQSLSSEYTQERYSSRVSELIVQVKRMLEDEMEPVRQLEMIDDLQNMGISYHFEDRIKQILDCIYFEQEFYKNDHETKERDLYSTALAFRHLRQHGFRVSQEIFDCFKSGEGEFKASLGENTKGLLQLYEASFVLTQGEKTLELAREFATKSLQKKLDGMDEYSALMVNHALELPLHWRIRRPNAIWFMDAYERRPSMNSAVLELAKLDFNIVQATLQEELKQVSRWWKHTCLAEKMPFVRDRMVESYFWNIGVLFPPQYEYPRMMVAKIYIFITIIDDIFDIHGTIEELQLLNEAFQRWDIEATNQLPDYMQMCFLAVDSFVNEVAYGVLKEQGVLIIQQLRKSWADTCRAYIQEAKWYSTGYKPTLEEYINNACISISAHTILCHQFFLITNPIEKETAQSLMKYHNIVRYSAILLRLTNDLGTSPHEMERGDVPKSVQCYMNETGASTEEAREYVKFMISETWQKMNEETVADSPFSQDFIQSAADLGRMGQYMYHYGDGHGFQNPQVMDFISTLLFQPI